MLNPDIIPYLIESNLILIILGLVYIALLRNRLKEEDKRYFILFSILFSFLTPLLHIESKLASDINFQVVLAEISTISTPSENITWSPTLLILGVYFIAFALLSFNFFRSLFSIARMIIGNNASAFQYQGKSYKVFYNAKSEFSFFNFIFLKNENTYTEREKQMIIAHEGVHAKEYHSLDLILMELATCLIWFNPIIYLLKNEIRQIHEIIADKETLKNYSIEEYKSLLVKQTINTMNLPILNYLSKRVSKTRLNHLIAAPRGSKLRAVFTLPIFVIMFYAFACTNQNTDSVNSITSKEDVSEVMTDPDQKPQFVGGMEGLFSHIINNLEYPKDAQREGKEGRVIVSFVVAKDGSINNVEIEEGFDKECEEEAMRVIKEMPAWEPGVHDGKAVDVKLSLPIQFKI